MSLYCGFLILSSSSAVACVYTARSRSLQGELCACTKEILHKALLPPLHTLGFESASLRRLFSIFEVGCCLRQFMSIVTGAGSLFLLCSSNELFCFDVRLPCASES